MGESMPTPRSFGYAPGLAGGIRGYGSHHLLDGGYEGGFGGPGGHMGFGHTGYGHHGGYPMQVLSNHGDFGGYGNDGGYGGFGGIGGHHGGYGGVEGDIDMGHGYNGAGFFPGGGHFGGHLGGGVGGYGHGGYMGGCLLYTSPSPRDATLSRMPSSA